MEKEQNQNTEEIKNNEPASEDNDQNSDNQGSNEQQIIEKSPEKKILELEDKLARTFAEMENQRKDLELRGNNL